jgi:hypothetical protein
MPDAITAEIKKRKAQSQKATQKDNPIEAQFRAFWKEEKERMPGTIVMMDQKELEKYARRVWAAAQWAMMDEVGDE